ncbi:MAG: hypothetical protein PHU21_09460 [Elusimicrobia bacterium]|nr:hypothetical protein [Elusimicrobiota bacterium]
MRAHAAGRIDAAIESGAYGDLRAWLAAADRPGLARDWPRLRPLRKLIAFKLMDAASALEFYRRLPEGEKYFLFCGFPLAAIAPVLEGAPPSLRRLFVQLPADFCGLMLRELTRPGPARAAAGRTRP